MRKLTHACIPLLFALSAGCGHAEQIFSDFGVPAWNRVSKYMQLKFGNLAKDEVVLVLPTATDAAWDDHNGIIRAMEMYKWGDWMPSSSWTYAPNAGKRVSDGYRYFLKAAYLATVDANGTISEQRKNALKRETEEVEYTRALYNKIQVDASDAYASYAATTPAPHRLTKAQFLKDQGYDDLIKTRKANLDTALARLKTLNEGIVDPDLDLLTNAEIRYDNPNQKVLLPPVKEVLNDRDRWQSYYSSWIDKDLFSFLKESRIQTENIQESSDKSDSFEQQWKASVSVSFLGLFRAGGASAEQVRREQHVQQNATRIDIVFDNIDTFPIVRGEWFNQGVIDRFAPRLAAENWTAMWGPNGLLELIPKSLLVAHGMSFTVYADQQSIDYLYEHFQGGADAGISIGWWRIGGGGNYSSTKEQTSVQKFADHITFTDLSGRAQVLGVLAKQYALSVPRPAPAALNFTAAQREKAMREINSLWVRPDLDTQLKGRIDAKSIRMLRAE